MSNGAGDEELVDFVHRARRGVTGGDALVVAVGERRVRVGGDVAARVLGALEGGEVAPRPASAGAERDRESGLPAAAGGALSAGVAAGAGAGPGVGPGARPPRVTLGDPAGVLGLAGAHGRRGVAEDLPPELTTGQAADLLGVSRRTVVQLIERGDLKATRVGTRRRLDTAEVAGHRERAKSKRPATLRDVIAASRDLDLYR
jgi:excisionase family DNA binding protein